VALTTLLVCLVASPVAVRAQEVDATSAAAARALFTEGVSLADGGRWADAVVRFRQALALRDSSVIAYNLGVALTHLGQPVEATELFRRVIRSSSTDDAVRADATASLATAEPQIAWVEVSYAAPTEGLTLRVDGHERPIALLGTSIPLDPGAHEILVLRGEDVAGRGAIELAAGAHAALALEIVALPVESPPPEVTVEAPPEPSLPPIEAPPPASDDSGLWIGLGVGGGVVLVAAAVVLVVVLVPSPEASPFSGSLGTVEIGR
jgi:tetratricopeptide (TPR) repeat protein